MCIDSVLWLLLVFGVVDGSVGCLWTVDEE